MTLGDIIQAMRPHLTAHFEAKPLKHHAARVKSAEKQILDIYTITVDALRDDGKIPWPDSVEMHKWVGPFCDIICNQWRNVCTEKMYEAYEAKTAKRG